MKTIVLNISPRKNGNTAQLLKAAASGAEAAGSETEYINVYDLHFTGCHGCMLCKRKGATRCHCYWKDDLSPLIDRIFAADTLLIGTAIYFGRPTSQYFALLERLHFTALSYDDYSNYFKGHINVGMFVAMNATQDLYDKLYKERFTNYAKELQFLNGEVSLYSCYDTVQVKDYTQYSMGAFDEQMKKAYYESQFPKDLENAYQLGKKLNS